MDLDDFFKQFSIDAVTESSTINGGITEQIGKIPEVGDCFSYGNLHIEVTETEGQKADEIHVTFLEKKEEEITESV